MPVVAGGGAARTATGASRSRSRSPRPPEARRRGSTSTCSRAGSCATSSRASTSPTRSRLTPPTPFFRRSPHDQRATLVAAADEGGSPARHPPAGRPTRPCSSSIEHSDDITPSQHADVPGVGRTVRDATFDLLRRRGLTRMFANPGSTEIPFLSGLPDDLEFVLALHEGSVIGLATGYAIGRNEPSLALLHTTAGLGNAVGAIATARVNRAPVVIVVGQQDRRHLSYEPFLSGPARRPRRRVPGTRRAAGVRAGRAGGDRARHARRGDLARAGARDRADGRLGGARRRHARARRRDRSRPARPRARTPTRSPHSSASSTSASAPAIVVGAGADDPDTWSALVALAERLAAPVYQAAVRGAGRLPAGSPALRRLPAGRARAACASASPRTTPCCVVGGPGVPRHALYARPVHRAGDASRDRHRGRRGGLPQPGRARDPRAPGRRLSRRRRRAAAARGRRCPSGPRRSGAAAPASG